MEKQKVIELIAGRIIDEYRKHNISISDWNMIAAHKIYSQWFEFLNEQITEKDKEIEKLTFMIDHGLGFEDLKNDIDKYPHIND